jgi:release factor glutamine methyltransferase
MADPKAAWTILEILRWTTEYFRDKGVSEPRASAEILLAHTLGVSRLDLYLRFDQPLNPEELARFKSLVVRRRQGEPVAYLTGHREFWSLDFHVNPAVLIPRPETETLVAATVEAAQKNLGRWGEERTAPPPSPNPSLPTPYRGLGGEFEGRVGELASPSPPLKLPLPWGLEVGVGSGAMVVALAKELPQMHWIGVDLSAAALNVARNNVRRHEVLDRVHLIQGDLLTGLKPQMSFGLLVANLPYVPRRMWETLPRDIKEYEPREAFWGGEDGLDLIRPLIRQAHQYIKTGGWVLLEVGDRQAKKVEALLQETGAYDSVEKIKDFSGIDRVVRARRRDTGIEA